MKTLLKVDNYTVSVLPGQTHLAQNFFWNFMLSTNSQQVNLAWGVSGLRVLLHFLVGTFQSILGDIFWHVWMVWRPSRIWSFLQ